MQLKFGSISALMPIILIISIIVVGCGSGGGGDSAVSPSITPTDSPAISPTVTPQPTDTPQPTVTPQPTPTTSPQSQEFYFDNPTSEARLWAKVYYPPEADGKQKYPGLVMIPGGLGCGSNFENAPDGPSDFAGEGFVVMIFDPDSRGNSEGDEDYNGIIHQDGLNELLKQLVADPHVDPDNIGVFTSSYGIALGAGALGRYPDNPTVHYLVDGEGPCDRFYITKYDDPHFLEIFDGHTTNDEEWWDEREAYRTVRTYPGIYLRLQTELDHVHREDKGHALLMIESATSGAYGGFGVCSWTRINGDENTPDTVYTEENPPQWLPPGCLQKVSIQFVKEMRDKRITEVGGR